MFTKDCACTWHLAGILRREGECQWRGSAKWPLAILEASVAMIPEPSASLLQFTAVLVFLAPALPEVFFQGRSVQTSRAHSPRDQADLRRLRNHWLSGGRGLRVNLHTRARLVRGTEVGGLNQIYLSAGGALRTSGQERFRDYRAAVSEQDFLLVGAEA